MNTFGLALRVSTFGESHGVGVGCVIDGIPAGLRINLDFITKEMRRRKGGGSYATPRKEDDEVEILSGVFEGFSTGSPLALFIKNTNIKSKDYDSIKNIFRPGHADFTYFHKYHIRDYRGGGRSSARESAARVAAGAIAKLLLAEFGIVCRSGILQIGEILGEDIDFDNAIKSEIFALDKHKEEAQKLAIKEAKSAGNSIGGCALIEASGKRLLGLGEPLYYKLDGAIGAAMLGLNGVKAVEIGEGVRASMLKGDENNDNIDSNGFLSNRCGGVLGGIGNGKNIVVRVYFKPTPSIFIAQQTIDSSGNPCVINLKGRHDSCIAVRGSVVCESMLALVLADMLILGAGARLENLKKAYQVY